MHYYLDRILDYYKDSEIRIMVADDSPDAYPNSARFSNLDYVHFKKCRSYAEKIFLSLQKVKTEYVIICDQDDFIIPESIGKCVDFLEMNKDYVSAQGNVIYFNPKAKNNIVWSPALLNMVGFNLESDIPSARISKYFKDYIGLYIAVHRRESALQAFWQIYDSPLEKHFGLLEYFTDFIYAIHGKHIVLPVFYDAKETLHVHKHGGFNLKGFSENAEVRNDYETYLEMISAYLAKHEPMEHAAARLVIESALRSYFGFSDATVYATPEHLAQPIKNKTLKNLVNRVPFIGVVKKQYIAQMRRQVLKRRIKDRINLIPGTKQLPGFPFYDPKAVAQKKDIEKYILQYWNTTYKN